MDRQIAVDVPVFGVAFSPKGDALHAVCADNKARVFSLNGGAPLRTFAWDQGDSNPTLTPHGLLTVGKDGAVKTWSFASGAVSSRFTPAGPRARRSAVSADGKLTASNVLPNPRYAETEVRVTDATGKVKYSVPAGLGGVGAVAISPDGSSIVAASYDADVRAWNAANGELLRLIDELQTAMFDLRFSPDGRYLVAAGAAREVYVFETKTWKIARKIPNLPQLVSALAFSGDGRLLATGGFEEITVQRPVKVIVWDFATAKPVRTVDAPHAVTGLALSPDGKLAAVAARERRIDLWQIPA